MSLQFRSELERSVREESGQSEIEYAVATVLEELDNSLTREATVQEVVVETLKPFLGRTESDLVRVTSAPLYPLHKKGTMGSRILSDIAAPMICLDVASETPRDPTPIDSETLSALPASSISQQVASDPPDAEGLQTPLHIPCTALPSASLYAPDGPISLVAPMRMPDGLTTQCG